MRKVVLALSAWLLTPTVLLATWAEPSCDPAADPTSCNISVPINVSDSAQSKSGSLTIGSGGTLTADGVFDVNGAATFDGSVTVNGTGMTINALLLVNNGLSVGTAGSSIFKNGVTLDTTSSFTYAGANTNFSLTADSIDDGEVSNALTASIFRGTGSTSDAVDLGDGTTTTSEVSGILPSSAVTDSWVNIVGDNMTGGLTMDPTTGRAIAIKPNTTSDGIWISGATGEALVSLNQTGNGKGIYLNTIVGVTGKGIEVVYAGSGYPVEIRSTGSSTQSLNVENGTTGGYGVYSVGSGTSGIGVGGAGAGYGVYGSSDVGTGGYFITAAASGTGLYATLGNSATTTSSKALEVVGKNGYGAYITADGDSSTGLYVENTNTTYGISKYAIQATAVTPAGEGIYAVSDYGRAGHFESNSGGTGIYINADGATYGIDVDAAGATAGIDITVDDGEIALDANNGEIKAEGGFRGGQFYASGSSSNNLYANIEPVVVDTLDFYGFITSPTQTGLVFDGSDIWVASGRNTSVGGDSVQRVNAYNGNLTADYAISTGFGGLTTGAIVYADEQIYAFASSSSITEYLVIDPYDDSPGTPNLTTGLNVRSGVYDGEDIWLGTNNSIAKLNDLAGITTDSTIQTGLGEIRDILYVDGYIWAMDTDNDVVYKISSSGDIVETISVTTEPVDLEYDGGSIWVLGADTTDLTRINPADNSTRTLTSSVSDGQAMTFDGVRLWIAAEDDILYGYHVATESVDASVELGSESESSRTAIFDGSYVWVQDRVNGADNRIHKVAVGRGHGYSMPLYPKGIPIYGEDGEYHCIYFDSSGALTDSTTMTNCR